MCGILGCILNRPLRPDEEERLRTATDALAHRGPDARGEFRDPAKGVFLGHRRLKIIDLSEASAQPMRRNGSVLVYNGEIYNYRELAAELAALGVVSKTSGDTEILLLSWLQWKEHALDKFDGMFAFALFDGHRFHLATDPFGEKPLYILERPEGVYFSSEPGPLRELFDVPFSPREEDVAAFLCLGFVPAPRTGYAGLSCLPPATHITIEQGRIVKNNRYWRPQPPSIGHGPVPKISEDDISAVEEVLSRSLERRLISDVPLGLFLSSGVDSVLIAALLAKKLHRDVSAVTVSFPDGADESAEAAAIARYFGLDHQIVDSRDDSSWKNMPEELLGLYGDLNDNTTALSVRQMCRGVRDRMTVAISGSGGDELFFGYQKYAFLYEKRHLYRWLAPVAEMLRPFMVESPVALRSLEHARNFLFVNREWQYLALKNGAAVNWLRRVRGAKTWARGLLQEYRGETAFRVRMFDLESTLPSSFIPAIERGSMSASVEVRTPFLSRELYAVLAGMDQRTLIAFGRKQLAFKLLQRYLPDELLVKRKQGFVMPRARYFQRANAHMSNLPGLGGADPAVVWQRRGESGFEGLALRLKILSAATD